MTAYGKKKLFLWIRLAALAAIAFSFTFATVYAWFYRDTDLPINLTQGKFEVIIQYEDKEPGESLEVSYIARASTIYGVDAYLKPYDAEFNSCVSCAQVSVTNLSDVRVKARVNISVVSGMTEIGIEDSAIKFAIILNKTRLEVESNKDAYGWPNYSYYIDEQIDDLSASDIDDMNQKALANLELEKLADDPLNKKEFLLAFWVDYNIITDPGGDYQYIPGNLSNPSAWDYKETGFTLKITVVASDMNYTG